MAKTLKKKKTTKKKTCKHPSPYLGLVQERMEKLGVNAYWLAKRLVERGGNEASAYRLLRGNSDINSRTMDMVFEALGIDVKPRGRFKAKK